MDVAQTEVAPALAGGWQSLPDMLQARVGHGFVVHGGCLWAIGGNANFNTDTIDVHLTAVEKFCPQVDPTRWVSGPPLPSPLSNFAGVGVIAGRILVAGGVTGVDTTVRTVFMLTPQGVWRSLADSLPVPTACGGGTVMNGRLYVYGADLGLPGGRYTCDDRFNTNQLLEFDPTRPPGQRWRNFGPMPGNNGSYCGYRLHDHGGLLAFDGGGACISYETGGFDHHFDPRSSQWRSGRLGITGLYPSVATVHGLALHAGGYIGDLSYDNFFEVSASDYSFGRTSPLPEYPNGAYMAEAVEFLGGLVISGGFSATVDFLPLTAGCDVHEPDGVLAQANPIHLRVDNVGNTLLAELGLGRTCSAVDVDHFRVFGPLYSDMRAELTPPPGVDLQLALYDATGTVLLARSRNAGSAIESVTLPAFGAQHYLRVQSQGGSFSTTQPYLLQLIPVQ